MLRQGDLAVDHADTKASSQPGTLPTKRSHDLPLLGTRQSWLHVKKCNRSTSGLTCWIWIWIKNNLPKTGGTTIMKINFWICPTGILYVVADCVSLPGYHPLQTTYKPELYHRI